MHREAQRIAAIVSDLPAIPDIANKVMAAVQDDSTSADDVRKILELDPGLSARVLKVANSSMYGFRREVETLRHAITLLGFKQVECLVMAASLRDVFVNFGLSEKLLWEHATLAGVAAGKLASYGPIGVDREAAFTAGLLHDLGKVALSNVVRDRYLKVVTRVYNEGISWVEAELEEFGFDHALLGAQIAKRWCLPDPLVHAIRHHHDPPSSYSESSPAEIQLTALTSVVTRVCTRLGLGRRGPVEEIDPLDLEAWWVLGLDESDREPVIELISEEAKSAEGLFG